MRVGTAPSRTYSERYGARSPWLVERWRVALYLIWRTLFALARPALFVVLLSGAVFWMYRGLGAAPVDAFRPAPPLGQRFETALQNAAGEQSDADVLTLWRAELDLALRPGQAGGPDLLRAESFANSLPALMGRESLALYLMRQDRRPELMQADLVAMPVWRRQQIISGVLEARRQIAPPGPAPVWLVEAPPTIRRRFDRAQALYGRSLRDAEDWFLRPDGLAINLAALPGVMAPDRGRIPPVLPDAREVIVQGCALAQAQQQRVPACERTGLVFPAADPVQAALALSLHDPALEPTPVRLALAARAAGRLQGDWLDRLMLGAPSRAPEMRLLTALMPVLADADRYYARPETCVSACGQARSEFRQAAGLDLEAQQRWFEAYDGIRRAEGALVALRTSDLLRQEDDVHALARVSNISDGRLLAGRILLEAHLVELGRVKNFFRPDPGAPEFWLAGLQFVLAMLLLGIVLIHGRLRRSGGAPGALERLDGKVSRLILGRNL